LVARGLFHVLAFLGRQRGSSALFCSAIYLSTGSGYLFK
jgi:hypothetical protein